jgi:hypothetical protein
MKTLMLAAAAVAVATAANAQTVVKEREVGNYSAPVAGATPQAREYPSEGTTVLREREKATVVEPAAPSVAVPAPSTGAVVTEPGASTVREVPANATLERDTQTRQRTPNVGDGTSRSSSANQN